AAPAVTDVTTQQVVEVRPIDTTELGAEHPSGITYDPASGALVIAGGSDAARHAARVTPQEDPLGSLNLPGGEPTTLAFDPRTNAVRMIAGQDLVSGASGAPARVAGAASGVNAPAGAAF